MLEQPACGLQKSDQQSETRPNRWGLFLVAWVVATSVSLAEAGNGINLIGFGIESNLMAGADVAVARDTGAVSTNPAGLTQIRGMAIDNHGGIAYGLGVRHRDEFGNDKRVDNEFIAGGDLSFAVQAPESPLTWSIGLFGQGGAGYVYKDLNTAFGTQDELSSLLRIAKLTPGMAYRVSDKLSLGLSIPIIYADLKQNIFSATSQFNSTVPELSFFGNELTGASASNAGIKLGLMYRFTDTFTLGVTYTNQIDLKLKGGNLKVNYDAIGLGRVTYGDAQVEGLHLPQELAIGAAQRLGELWLVSFKLSWLDWSRAFRSTTLTASSPDNALAPQSINNSAALNWRDQYVIAIGLAYEANAGYNPTRRFELRSQSHSDGNDQSLTSSDYRAAHDVWIHS